MASPRGPGDGYGMTRAGTRASRRTGAGAAPEKEAQATQATIERRMGRERRGQGDELAAMLTEAFCEERRASNTSERRRDRDPTGLLRS